MISSQAKKQELDKKKMYKIANPKKKKNKVLKRWRLRDAILQKAKILYICVLYVTLKLTTKKKKYYCYTDAQQSIGGSCLKSVAAWGRSNKIKIKLK